MSVENVREIDVGQLDPNPFQARMEYPEEELSDLGLSIKQHGMLQPIVARPIPTQPGRYQIAVGGRRVRACQLASIARVLVIVRDLSDQGMD